MKTNGYHEDRFRLTESELNTFYTKKGALTRYALSCGCVEQAEKNGGRVRLGMTHGTFYVLATRDDKHIYESFKNLSAARKRFRECLKIFLQPDT